MTLFWKIIFPAFWLGGFGLGTVVLFFADFWMGPPMLFGFLIGLALFYFGTMKAKKVHIDDNYLYVSNFRKHDRIPLRHVKSVSDFVLLSPRPIFVEFKVETNFGKEIMFLGYFEFFLFFSTHPAVKEIRKRIEIVQ